LRSYAVIRRNRKQSKGPEVAVPGTKQQAPPTGRSSFAVRVRRRRKKEEAEATARGGKPPSEAPAKARKTPSLRTREERVEIAKTSAEVPGPADVPTAPKPPAPSQARPAPARKRVAPEKPSPVSKAPVQREPDDGFVAVGRVHVPFGLKGELRVTSLTDNPDRFRPKARLWAGQQPVTIAASREAGGFVYLTFKGFGDRTSVEKFRHALLQVPESELPELEEGEYYRFQLVGLQAVDTSGKPIGVLAEVLETGATDVYRIRTQDGEDILVAATAENVRSVDLAAKRMVVDPPAWT